jgi:predicted enzyme related to lactoylglutathione lyase
MIYVKDLPPMTAFYAETLGLWDGIDPEGNIFGIVDPTAP